jgi:hypothetical protein
MQLGEDPKIPAVPPAMPKHHLWSIQRRRDAPRLRHCPYAVAQFMRSVQAFSRAEEGTRTPDLPLTRRLLYQLSYFGEAASVT